MEKSKILLLIIVLLIGSPVFCWGKHGLSIDGHLKYPADFKRFDYVSADAQKGGELILHSLGSFDKMNPFTLKGTAPDGLESMVFEPLAQSSLDEPFAQYGLIAKDIAVADDNLSMVYTLNENATFSDGTAVTAQDVKFTIETLQSDLVHPLYPYYYADVQKVEIIDDLHVKFHFKKLNHELPLIVGQMSILSKQFYEEHDFDSKDMIAPIGSGPYVVEKFSQGKSITYKRNPHYWAADHPVRRGMHNFDRITIKYYKDQIVAVEAFKAGEFDAMLVNIAKQWVRDMSGNKFDDREIIKKKFPHSNNAGMQGFVMNTRRPVFKDPSVRKAVGLAFDFEWVNKTLFYDQYVRSRSFFSNSHLAATGLPTKDELELLEPFRSRLPEDVFLTPIEAPSTQGKLGLRENLRKAAEILKDGGWNLKDGVLQNSVGTKLSFEIILVSPSFERVMAAYTNNLKKIGVMATYRTIDPALYTDRINKFDFDMCVFVYGQSQSPGNEQRNYWHSTSAETRGSRNLAGVNDPVVDALVEQIIYADTREKLVVACKALDRVLWYGYYLVPNWYLDGHRIAFHNKFKIPLTIPTYYDYMSFLMTWWQ